MINNKFRSEEVSRANYEVIRKYDNVFYYIKEVDGTFSLALGAKEIGGAGSGKHNLVTYDESKSTLENLQAIESKYTSGEFKVGEGFVLGKVTSEDVLKTYSHTIPEVSYRDRGQYIPRTVWSWSVDELIDVITTKGELYEHSMIASIPAEQLENVPEGVMDAISFYRMPILFKNSILGYVHVMKLPAMFAQMVGLGTGEADAEGFMLAEVSEMPLMGFEGVIISAGEFNGVPSVTLYEHMEDYLGAVEGDPFELSFSVAVDSTTVFTPIGIGQSTEVDGKITLTNTQVLEEAEDNKVIIYEYVLGKLVQISGEGGQADLSKYVTHTDLDAAIAEVSSGVVNPTEFDYDNAVNITHADLKNKLNTGTALPKTFYIITDYETVTFAEATRTEGHHFNVGVYTISESELQEDAWAIARSGDTYFVQNDLSKWRLKYTIDNGPKYDWGDGEGGKGVIYEMLDEFGNFARYDFKNITFKRYKVTGGTMFDEQIYYPGNDYDYLSPYFYGSEDTVNNLNVDGNDFIFAYTFTNVHFDGSTYQISDKSILKYSINGSHACYNNKIYVEISEGETIELTYDLPYNVFLAGDDYDLCDNTLQGSDIYHNTFRNSNSIEVSGNFDSNFVLACAGRLDIKGFVTSNILEELSNDSVELYGVYGSYIRKPGSVCIHNGNNLFVYSQQRNVTIKDSDNVYVEYDSQYTSIENCQNCRFTRAYKSVFKNLENVDMSKLTSYSVSYSTLINCSNITFEAINTAIKYWDIQACNDLNIEFSLNYNLTQDKILVFRSLKQLTLTNSNVPEAVRSTSGPDYSTFTGYVIGKALLEYIDDTGTKVTNLIE